ncbi:cation-transporting ATPase [Microbacterium sp. NPDC077663]|uniref:cation-transporting ATPase n=1 Tax=Microbacterium sp. NPDC077663 TaxID=3364189 RepID=UPI0037CC3DA7
MSKLSRLIGMAAKALDSSSSSASTAGRPTGAGDWRGMVRSAADAIAGDGRGAPDTRTAAPSSAGSPVGLTPPPAGAPASAATGRLSAADRQAIARYDYLLQTADPRQVEQIHREAFARLTPEQRAHVQSRMATELPAGEQPLSSSPADLARAAARGEATRPGMLRGLLARAGSNGGAGRLAGGAAIGVGAGVLGAVAGGAIVTSVAGPLLAQAAGLGVDFDALAAGMDLEGIAGDTLSGVGEQVSGLGEHVSGLGDDLGGFALPGLDDIFGR